jgi:hypothetical protein
MRRFHHIGIPTKTPRPGETYLPLYKVYYSGFETSPFGVEWMRYEPDCPLPEIVKTVPHVAFEVDDLERELEGREVIIAPNSPSAGVRVAFIEDNGAPIELLCYDKPGDTKIKKR